MANFFSEFKVINKYENINVYIALFLGVILLGIFNLMPEQRANATVFFVMLIVWGFAQHINRINKLGNQNFGVLGVGTKQAFVSSVVIGAFLALFLVSQSFNVVPVFSSVVSVDFLLGFLYVVICAPIIEANFFRGLLMPSSFVFFGLVGLKNNFLKGVLAVVVSAGFFAWFHTSVFSGDSTSLVVAFVFGLVAGVGVYFFRSIGFEYGLHGVNNYLAWVSMFG